MTTELSKSTNFASANSAMIKSIFLLLLAVSGNFAGDTLNCKAQYHMSNNMIVKHMIILTMIYFTLNFTSSDTPHPLEVAKKTAVIWMAFIMFTKMTGTFTLVGILILIAFFVLTNLIDYEKNQQETNSEQEKKQSNNIKTYENIQQTLFFIFIGTLITGFILYMMEKRKEYGNKFEIQKFLLGVTKCNRLR